MPRPARRLARLAFPLAATVALGTAPARGQEAAPPPPRPPAETATSDSIRYAIATTDINRVGLTLSNYGFFGNNFNTRSPSFEFPLGSGYEHMSRAGLWIGARALSDTGVFTGVTTAIVDNAQGTAGTSETEFTPAGVAVVERSRIQNSKFFSKDAVSDQDLDCSYSDQPGKPASGYQSERHTPLNILVHQRMLGFTLGAAQDFEIVRLAIHNQGPPLRDMWVAMYAQLTSGNRNAYPLWPPSSNSPQGSWYFKTHAEYDAQRRLYKEHYCAGPPYPGSCNFAYCPPWASVKLLATWPPPVDSLTQTFHVWSYNPGDPSRALDVQKYAFLTSGQIDDPATCVPGGSCSPIMLLAVGPFAQIDPGDSVGVDFAFVGGDDETALLRNADYAQFASDIHYVLPQPPPSPRLHVEAAEQRLDLYWDDSPERAVDPTSPAPGHLDFEGYRVYLGTDRQHPQRVAQFDAPDTTGFNTGFDAIRLAVPRWIDGIPYTYRYSIRGLRDGFNYFGAVTSYDIGSAQTPSLESGISENKFQAVPGPAPGESRAGATVFPNPYRVEARWDQGRLVRDHYLWFANLPPRATLRIYTLSGDLVFETRFDGASYRGEGARGLYDPTSQLDTPPPSLSGTSYAWNLISSHGQAVATGLYLYSVEDLATGRVSRGKFLLVKSDREN